MRRDPRLDAPGQKGPQLAGRRRGMEQYDLGKRDIERESFNFEYGGITLSENWQTIQSLSGASFAFALLPCLERVGL